MKKKVSFKNYSEENSVIEPIKLSVNSIEKKNIFNNKSEIIVKNILEKIIINVIIRIKSKELDSLICTVGCNYVMQEINSLLSNSYISYEKEDYFFSNTIFIDNYLREESTWDECNITQPVPGKIDRWKIYGAKIVDFKNINQNQITETDEGMSGISGIYDRKSQKTLKFKNISKLAKKIKEDKEKEKVKEIEKEMEEEEINKIKKLGVRIMDSFPSYPLSDELFKIEVNLTKEQQKQIDQYRAELLVKDELKKKEKEKKQKIEKMRMKIQTKSKENEIEGKKNKTNFRGKSIGVTTNGEIIFIQNVNINHLKSDFLEIHTKMRNYFPKNPNTTKASKKSLELLAKNNEIEKNIVDETNLDFFRINNKEKMNQQIITGGSSFKNFIPETGVSLKQNGNMKSGGTDFLHKYKKISLEQFEKTLDMFKRSNLANTELFEIKKETTPANKNNNNNQENNNSNILNSKSVINNKSSIVNNNTSNYNYVNQKSLIKSSSLPELNQLNSRANLEASNIFNAINNLNINVNNDSNIKNSFNMTNYNNSNFMSSTKYSNMNNFIKTSTSFKNLFYKDDYPNPRDENIIPNYTTKQFFKNFHPKKTYTNLHQKGRDSLTKIQDFNSNIVNDNNWGSVVSNISRNYTKVKPLISSVKKNYFNKTLNDMFRVRSNVNETYAKKMRVFNKISLRSQSTENKNGIKKIVFDKK